MESENPSANNEEQVLLNQIQILKNKANQSLNSLKISDINEIRALARPHEIVLLVLSAVLLGLDNERDPNIWDKIRRRLSQPNQFLSDLMNRDFMIQPLTSSQLEAIKKIYESHPNLTQSARNVSRLVHLLSLWLEASVEISIKQQSLSVIRNS